MGAPVPVADLPDEHKFVPKEDIPGSVFDNPSVGTRLKRIGKAIAPPAAGIGTAVEGAEIGGALGGPPGALAGAAVGGAASPFVERAMDASVNKQPFQAPSVGDVVRSTVANTAFTGAGLIGGGLTEKAGVDDATREEFAKLPQAQRTTANLKKIQRTIQDRAASASTDAANIGQQDLRNRDF
jgi:hypothetical protein